MVFIDREEYNEQYIEDYDLFDRISFYDDRVINACLQSIDTEKLVTVLNTINNQGIESINPLAGTYVVKGATVPIARLSTGEKIFFIAEVSTQTKTRVGFGYCIHQLSNRTLRTFYNTFINDYIAVVADDRFDKEVLYAACTGGK